MRQSGVFILAIALSAFQFGCSQTPSVETKANLSNANAAPSNQNAAVVTANAANLNAEIVEAKNYSKAIKAQAEEMGQSFKSGDFEKFFGFIHPKVFEMAGGRDVLIKQSREAFEEAKSEGFGVESYTVGEPKSAVAVEKELFVVVPVSFITKEPPKETYKNESTLIAVSSDDGASWKFLSDMNQARFKALFPAAATKLVIPEDKVVPVAQK